VRRVARAFAAQADAARARGLTEDFFVDRASAIAANTGSGAPKEHVEWRQQPLKWPHVKWDAHCPPDDATFGARGLSFALGGLPPQLPARNAPLFGPAGAPTHFLTYSELVGYYKISACSAFFFPGLAADRKYDEQIRSGVWPVFDVLSPFSAYPN
jgi:hypothetical protein